MGDVVVSAVVTYCAKAMFNIDNMLVNDEVAVSDVDSVISVIADGVVTGGAVTVSAVSVVGFVVAANVVDVEGSAVVLL